jgi:4-alpha-glucanotransferase
MNDKFNFLMAIHFHQPVDNFGFVFEKISDECYEPFLKTIEEFPDIKFNLHYSGSLLEWFKEYRPDIIDPISRLVKKGQVEIIGGGFYEPVISAIPRCDAIGQIQMMSIFLKEHFNAIPEGAWLAERVWEPSIPEILADSDIRYTIIDDQHLAQAGCEQDSIYGHFITESNLKTVKIIPSDKFLRYSIPFKPHRDSFDYMKKIIKTSGMNAVCYGDDGEKFGAWPGTYKSVYERGWLKKFLELLMDNASWISTRKISDYLNENTPNRNVYIPSISYYEMNKWSLPAKSAAALDSLQRYLEKNNMLDKSNVFLKAGIWKNFMTKYPEINHLHKRVSWISSRLKGLEKKLSPKKSAQTKKQLYKAQCNCVYWHGVFGGVYLYHLRASAYKHLIRAEDIIESFGNKKTSDIKTSELDFDCDGKNEFIVNTEHSVFVLDAENTASISEWSLKRKPLNILNTLSRRKEFYHKTGNKKLYYDNYTRTLFIDRFLSTDVTLQALQKNKYRQYNDPADSSFDYISIIRPGTIEARRKTVIGDVPVDIKKRFCFGKEQQTLKVSYEITGLSSKALQAYFASEMNFSLTKDDNKSSILNAKGIILADEIENVGIDIGFSRKADKLFRYPVYTLSQTQKDPETNYQATCIVPVFKICLDKKSPFRLDITIKADL